MDNLRNKKYILFTATAFLVVFTLFSSPLFSITAFTREALLHRASAQDRGTKAVAMIPKIPPSRGLPGIVHSINLGNVSILSIQNIGGGNISSLGIKSDGQIIDYVHLRGTSNEIVSANATILNLNKPLPPGESLFAFVAWHKPITSNKTETTAPLFWIGDKLHYDPIIVNQTHFAIYASENTTSVSNIGAALLLKAQPPSPVFDRIQPDKHPEITNQLLEAANLVGGPSNPQDWFGAKYAICWYYSVGSGDDVVDAHDAC